MVGAVQMTLIPVVLALSVATSITACGESKNAAAPGDRSASEKTAAAHAGDPAEDEAVRASAVAAGIISARNACDLLTQADAEAAVGQTLKKNAVNLTLGMCDYNALDFSAGASLTVGAWESIKRAALTGAHQPKTTSGVGDEALWQQVEGLLYVRKGDEGFALNLHGPKINPLPDKGLTVYKVLAQRVLAHY